MAAHALFAQVVRLEYRIVDAEYSTSLDRVVSVSAAPHSVHLFDANRGITTASIPLPAPPTSVSVGPSGKTAVAGHDGYFSVLDLERAILVRTFQVPFKVADVVDGGNGFAYLFVSEGYWGPPRTIRLADGVDVTTEGDGISNATKGRLHPSGSYIYATSNSSTVNKYDIRGGAAKYMYASDYSSHGEACGEVWPTPDGMRLMTGCGTMLRASEVRDEDMRYNGTLSGVAGVIGAAHALLAKRLLVLPWARQAYGSNTEAAEVAIFEYDFLSPVLRTKLPPLEVNNRTVRSLGKFVFASRDGDKAIIVQQADPAAGLLLDYCIATISIKNQVLNSASLYMTSVSPGSIVSLFGQNLAPQSAVPPTNPPPETLIGRTAKFEDRLGIERIAWIYYIGPDQANVLIPPDTALGPGRLILDTNTARLADVRVQVESLSPGIYAANGNGQGPAAAIATRVDGSSQSVSLTFQRDPTASGFVNRPLELGTTTSRVYVSLFGTGFRRATRVTATIGSINVPVSAFAPQPEVEGLDQVNLGPIPLTLRGQSNVPIVLSFDGKETNPVTLSFSY